MNHLATDDGYAVTLLGIMEADGCYMKYEVFKCFPDTRHFLRVGQLQFECRVCEPTRALAWTRAFVLWKRWNEEQDVRLSN